MNCFSHLANLNLYWCKYLWAEFLLSLQFVDSIMHITFSILIQVLLRGCSSFLLFIRTSFIATVSQPSEASVTFPALHNLLLIHSVYILFCPPHFNYCNSFMTASRLESTYCHHQSFEEVVFTGLKTVICFKKA